MHAFTCTCENAHNVKEQPSEMHVDYLIYITKMNCPLIFGNAYLGIRQIEINKFI